MQSQLSSGITYLPRGFQLITKPGIRQWVIVPLIINLIVLGTAISIALNQVQALVDWTHSYLDGSWLSGLSVIAAPLIWVFAIFLSAMFVFYVFAIVANWIAAPFNGPLSEAVEAYLTGTANPASWSQVVTDLPRVLAREWQKLLYYIPRALLMLFALFIPIIGPLLWFLFSAWMMSVQYADYPMDCHKVPFKKAIKLLKTQRWQSISFGGSVMLLTMVPFINLLVMPAAVAGGTLMWVERFRDENRLY
ncbi:MAG: sulfate transporter CysZ [Pseudomonadota bacterium]